MPAKRKRIIEKMEIKVSYYDDDVNLYQDDTIAEQTGPLDNFFDDDLFNKAVEAINKEYEKRGIDPSSLTKIIDRYYPTHSKEVHEIEKQMFECLNNERESYRGILRKWYELIIKEIDLYEGFLE